MARKVLTQYVDDLTGKEIAEGEGGPVAFALGGERYEIDLSNENADKFRELMGRYVSAARNVTRLGQSSSGHRRSSSGRSEADRERARMIREWAVANGHMRPESRGRIPGAIVEMWENRGKGTQTAMPSPAPADPLAAKGRELAATFVDDKGNPVDPSKKAQGETAKPAKPVAPKKEAAREPAKA